MEVEMANFAGFSQAGAPVINRGSINSPRMDPSRAGIITIPAMVRGALAFQSRRKTWVAMGLDISIP